MAFSLVDGFTSFVMNGASSVNYTHPTTPAVDDHVFVGFEWRTQTVGVTSVTCTDEANLTEEVPAFAATNPSGSYHETAYALDAITTASQKTVTINLASSVTTLVAFSALLRGGDETDLVYGYDTNDAASGNASFTVANVPDDSMVVGFVGTFTGSLNTTLPAGATRIALPNLFWTDEGFYNLSTSEDTHTWPHDSSGHSGWMAVLNVAGGAPVTNHPFWALGQRVTPV